MKNEPPRKPLVTVETKLLKDRLEILVSDNGPGVPAEIREKIFEPLFSTKNFGVGLGLPTVSQIMKQHGGGVSVRKKRGGGAKFALWLPLAGELEIADT
jgi:signal transduction histidine kinase